LSTRSACTCPYRHTRALSLRGAYDPTTLQTGTYPCLPIRTPRTQTHTHMLYPGPYRTHRHTHTRVFICGHPHTLSLFLSHRRARDPTVPPTQTHTRVSQCGHQTHTHSLFLRLSLSGGHATLPHHTHGHAPVSPHQPHVPRSSALSKGAVAHSHVTSHEPKTPQPPAPLTGAQKVMCVCVCGGGM